MECSIELNKYAMHRSFSERAKSTVIFGYVGHGCTSFDL